MSLQGSTEACQWLKLGCLNKTFRIANIGGPHPGTSVPWWELLETLVVFVERCSGFEQCSRQVSNSVVTPHLPSLPTPSSTDFISLLQSLPLHLFASLNASFSICWFCYRTPLLWQRASDVSHLARVKAKRAGNPGMIHFSFSLPSAFPLATLGTARPHFMAALQQAAVAGRMRVLPVS